MSQNTEQIIHDSLEVLVPTYKSQPIVLDRGEGVRIWDVDGKEYLDFACAYAVASLGHAHPAVLKTLNEQASKLMTCQASYATQPKLDCANLLIERSPFDLVYFSNSGTESVECAFKMARKWSYDKKGEGHSQIISFRDAFHGRTMGAASLTEKRYTQPYFAPYIENIDFATFNDLDSVKAIASKKTAAIIVEPVQGEGGLNAGTPEFLHGLRALCDALDIALVYDEVQAGMGRMGTLFAFESFADAEGNVPIPDIVCLAKGLGSGFPVGAVLAKREFGEAIQPGTHGTTYGGNPLATAVAHTVVSHLCQPQFLENVAKTSAYFKAGLEELQRQTNKITQIKGKGLMVGIDTSVDTNELILRLQKNGLLTTNAGKATLRMTPPLIATTSHMQEALDVLSETLKEMD